MKGTFTQQLKLIVLIPVLFLCNMIVSGQLVSTVAGNYITSTGYGGDGTNAINLHILPTGGVNDASGNIYFINGNAIRRLNTSTGIVATIAGSVSSGFAGDGVNANTALLNSPSGLALDAAKTNLYVSDQSNHRIRKIVIATNIITTIAGTGTAGFSGDGTAAVGAKLNYPSGIVLDASGNIFITDKTNQRIRKIAAVTGFISTIAGTGAAGFAGDGVAATAAQVNNPTGIAIDGSGNIYFADRSNNRIRKIAASNGFISTLAGNGATTFAGDGAAATAAAVKTPNNIVLDASTPTAIYISDANNRIRKVTLSTGIITTYAGTGVRGFSGDGSAAASATLSFGAGGGISNTLSIDATGNLYFADGSNRIRKINKSNTVISTIAGNNSYSGDGGAATNAQLKNPGGVAVDNSGNVYIADYGNHRIRKIEKATGNISTYAGNGLATYAGDSGLAINASLRNPSSILFDNGGNLIIADQGNSVIRMVDAISKKIYTIAGTGIAGFSGDNGDAKLAKLYFPSSIAIDENNNLFIADQVNYRIRTINSSTGIIKTIAGTGTSGYSGDNGSGLSAKISTVAGLAYFNGNLYIADQTNNAVRVLDPSYNIYAFAGDGTVGYSGDGASAITAQLTSPSGLAVDSLGNVYIADADNAVIRRVNQVTGFINTIAGNGTAGYSGDGGQALAATFNYPYALAFGTSKQLYVADKNNSVIRLLTAQLAFPVALSSFTASLADKKTVELKWTTRQEINSRHFLVERSINGVDYETIGQVKAAGNSTAINSYKFMDNIHSLSASTIYYRLKQVDNDGKSTISGVRSVDVRNAAGFVSIYPNPVSQILFINGNELSSVNLYDINGRLLRSYKGQQFLEINVSSLNEGVYIVSAQKNDGTKESKTIIVKH